MHPSLLRAKLLHFPAPKAISMNTHTTRHARMHARITNKRSRRRKVLSSKTNEREEEEEEEEGPGLTVESELLEKTTPSPGIEICGDLLGRKQIVMRGEKSEAEARQFDHHGHVSTSVAAVMKIIRRELARLAAS